MAQNWFWDEKIFSNLSPNRRRPTATGLARPLLVIIEKLQNLGVNVHIYDPYFSSSQVFGIDVEENLDSIISQVDAAIIITAHNEFKKITPSIFNQMKSPILIDTRGIIDPADAKQAKLIFRGLGRGKL